MIFWSIKIRVYVNWLKWIDYLSKVSSSLRKNLDPPIFHLYEAYDHSLVLIKILLCAAVYTRFGRKWTKNSVLFFCSGFFFDQFRKQLLLGTEDGLYCVDLQKNEFVKITEKRVFAIEICNERNMEIFVIISGNRRTIRLLPSSCALDGGHDLQVALLPSFKPLNF